MPTAKPNRRTGQLPAGRHGLDREFVETNQRSRILRAVSVVCARTGFPSMSVEEVISEAGVSRRTFYDHYPNREAVFLDAFEQATERLVAEVEQAYLAADSFVEGVQDCIEAYLSALAAAPEVAHMAVVEVLAAGPTAIEQRNQTMARLAAFFVDGAERFEQPVSGPALVPQTIVGGIYEVVYTRVLRGDAATLPELLPDFAFAALLPYVGNEAAQAEYERLAARRDRLKRSHG